MDRILALDISTKTGWAFALSSDENGIQLIDYGTNDKLSEPEGRYPENYIIWAYNCFELILNRIKDYNPTILIIEETAGGSKDAHSQKILEFIHFLVAHYIRSTGFDCQYYETEAWRRIVGCLMTKEEKLKNKTITKARKDNPDQKVIKVDGKRIGKVRRKHVNVRRANEIFSKQLKEPLIMKNEDQADAMLMAYAFHITKRPVNE